MLQITLASLPYLTKKKVTKRERFLDEMEKSIPWDELLSILRKQYRENDECGRPSMAARVMLRIYFLQQWFQLSDPGAEEALYDSASMRKFVGVELGQDAIPDETTILNFRHLLEEHNLTKLFFEKTNVLLEKQGLLVKSGTIVDATIIDAPSSTKNTDKQRDPEMKQTKKGNQWYFGMKAHVGTDCKRGIVHSLETTAANVHDSQVFEVLLHGAERSVYADSAYANEEKRSLFEREGVAWRVSRKANRNRQLTKAQRLRNRRMSKVRAFGEHAFQVVKCLWGYTKVRYRGLYKNTCQLFALFFLSNIYRLRHKLIVAQP
jgi:IS5 family transposase